MDWARVGRPVEGAPIDVRYYRGLWEVVEAARGGGDAERGSAEASEEEEPRTEGGSPSVEGAEHMMTIAEARQWLRWASTAYGAGTPSALSNGGDDETTFWRRQSFYKLRLVSTAAERRWRRALAADVVHAATVIDAGLSVMPSNYGLCPLSACLAEYRSLLTCLRKSVRFASAGAHHREHPLVQRLRTDMHDLCAWVESAARQSPAVLLPADDAERDGEAPIAAPVNLAGGVVYVPGEVALDPLLEVVRSPEVPGIGTGVALGAIERLLHLGVARGVTHDDDVDALVAPLAAAGAGDGEHRRQRLATPAQLGRCLLTRRANASVIPRIVASISRCRFEASDAATDEVVLSRILKTLTATVQWAFAEGDGDKLPTAMDTDDDPTAARQVVDHVGSFCSNVEVPAVALIDAVETCLRIAVGRGRQRSYLLTKVAEDAVLEMTRRFFHAPAPESTLSWLLSMAAAMADPELARHLHGSGADGRSAAAISWLGIKSAAQQPNVQLLGLRVLRTAMDASAGRLLEQCAAVRDATLREVCVALLRCCGAADDASSTEVLSLALNVALALVDALGAYAKPLLGALLTQAFPMYLAPEQPHAASSTWRALVQEVALEALLALATRCDLLTAAFAMFDCDPTAPDALEPLLATLSVLPDPLAMWVLASAVSALGERAQQQRLAPEVEPEAALWQATRRRLQFKRQQTRAARRLNRMATPANTGGASSLTAEQLAAHLHAVGVLGAQPSAAELARFLRYTPDLSKSLIGYVIGEPDTLSRAVLHEYASCFRFEGRTPDAALRVFLESFRLPGEGQKIDRIMQAFAERYYAQNRGRGPLASADAAHVLSFAIVMLNTDQHNESVKRRMTVDDFIRNNRGINDGGDLPPEFLRDIFERIQGSEIRLSEEHGLARLDEVHWDQILREDRQEGVDGEAAAVANGDEALRTVSPAERQQLAGRLLSPRSRRSSDGAVDADGDRVLRRGQGCLIGAPAGSALDADILATLWPHVVLAGRTRLFEAVKRNALSDGRRDEEDDGRDDPARLALDTLRQVAAAAAALQVPLAADVVLETLVLATGLVSPELLADRRLRTGATAAETSGVEERVWQRLQAVAVPPAASSAVDFGGNRWAQAAARTAFAAAVQSASALHSRGWLALVQLARRFCALRLLPVLGVTDDAEDLVLPDGRALPLSPRVPRWARRQYRRMRAAVQRGEPVSPRPHDADAVNGDEESGSTSGGPGGGLLSALLTGFGLGGRGGGGEETPVDSDEWLNSTDDDEEEEEEEEDPDAETTVDEGTREPAGEAVADASPSTAAGPSGTDDFMATAVNGEGGGRRRGLDEPWQVVKAVIPRYLRVSAEERAAAHAARECVAACSVHRVWASTSDAAAVDELAAVLAVVLLPERRRGLSPGRRVRPRSPRQDAAAAYLVDVLLQLTLSHEQRLGVLWPRLHQLVLHELTTVVPTTRRTPYALERTVVALLRVSVRYLMHRDVRSQRMLYDEALQDLSLLLKLPPPVFAELGDVIACGVYQLLHRYADQIRGISRWHTLLSLVEGGARRPPPACRASLQAMQYLLDGDTDKAAADEASTVEVRVPTILEAETFPACSDAVVALLQAPDAAVSAGAVSLLPPLLQRLLQASSAATDTSCSSSDPSMPLWHDESWLPLLQALQRACADERTAVRDAALSVLERTLADPATGCLRTPQRAQLFTALLFPLSEALPRPPPCDGDRGDASAPSALERVHLRVCMLLAKAWLQHQVPLAEVPEFAALWLHTVRLLRAFYDTACQPTTSPADGRRYRAAAARTPPWTALAEHVPETLKNALLVMMSNGLLRPPFPTDDDGKAAAAAAAAADASASRLWADTFVELAPRFPSLEEELLALPTMANVSMRDVEDDSVV